MEYKMLFTPMNIGTVQIKNRVVMPPMMLGFGQFNGCPTKEMMDYYEERAIGGAGLQWSIGFRPTCNKPRLSH